MKKLNNLHYLLKMHLTNLACAVRILVFVFFIILNFSLHTQAQSGSPIFWHFTTEDGLPSSEVYFALQDSKGAMWFATDHGVTRYNGYEFRTFTTKDGLSDNTVFKLFEDDKKRVWMLTFSGKIFYFENNTIHPYKYNGLLNKANENIIPLGIFVDRDENIFVTFLGKGELKIDSLGMPRWKFPESEFLPQKYFIDEFDPASLLISASYNYTDKKGHPVMVLHTRNSKTDTISFPTVSTGKFNAIRIGEGRMLYALANSLYEINGREVKFLSNVPFEVSFLMKEKNSKRIWVGTANGVYCYDDENFNSLSQHYLEKKSVSGITCDNEGGYWFTTLNDGVYYLPSDAVHGIFFSEEFLQKPLCFTLAGSSSAYAAYNGGALVELKEGKGKMIYRPPINTELSFAASNIYLDAGSQKIYLAQSQAGYISSGSFHFFKNKLPRGLQTNFLKHSDGSLYCCGSSFIFKVQNDSLAILKYVGQRINCIAETPDHHFLLGKNSGVLLYNEQTGQTTEFNKALNNVRIDDIQPIHAGFCFSTKGKGVLFFVNNHFESIDESKGLCSDLVSKLFVNGNDVWCATNKGVGHIHFSDFEKFQYSISGIHSSDGLLSDEINDIIELNDAMYVATKSGISFFNKNVDFVNHIQPIVQVTSLRVNNTDTTLQNNLEFSHNQNNLKIGFSGVSYRSKEKIRYHYMLSNGSDTISEFTPNRDVEFLSLAPGHYTFGIAAINNSGVFSTQQEFSFYIHPAWWQTGWFRILLLVMIVAAIYMVYKNQVRKIREKFEIERNEASLHLTALRAQMNPHFIFNMMSSIRHYMHNNDTASAEKYLTSFAKHLRNTLDNSEVQEISLEEELSALKIYAELEKQGVENEFEFTIRCDERLDTNETMVPSLLLQPFVENAIKHGIGKLDGAGKILVEIKKCDDLIFISIEDNGVGRKESEKWNSMNNGKHISHGTANTFDRITAFNKAYNKNIVATVIDLTGENGKAKGTRVEIRV